MAYSVSRHTIIYKVYIYYRSYEQDSCLQIGTIGGNLALKNAHHEFQSDVFLIFETVNAVVTLGMDQ